MHGDYEYTVDHVLSKNSNPSRDALEQPVNSVWLERRTNSVTKRNAVDVGLMDLAADLREKGHHSFRIVETTVFGAGDPKNVAHVFELHYVTKSGAAVVGETVKIENPHRALVAPASQ